MRQCHRGDCLYDRLWDWMLGGANQNAVCTEIVKQRACVLIIKPTRCTNSSNLFCNKTTCFGQFLCPSSGVFHCTHSNGICHTGLLTASEQDHTPLLCVQWKSPDDGQRNCSKHVELFFQNKFEEWVHLVGFIIRIYHDARSPERQWDVYFCVVV